MRKALFALVAVAMLAFAGTAVAGKIGTAKPWEYDPGNTGSVVAKLTKDGLSLQKNTGTATNAAAGADIKGIEGETLESLSFEVKDDACCGAGAPCFNVYNDGATSFLGCTYGEKTDAGDGWTRVTFDADELGAAGLFGQTIRGADIVMDDHGKTLLRNIAVNDVAISR